MSPEYVPPLAVPSVPATTTSLLSERSKRPPPVTDSELTLLVPTVPPLGETLMRLFAPLTLTVPPTMLRAVATPPVTAKVDVESIDNPPLSWIGPGFFFVSVRDAPTLTRFVNASD